MNKIKLKQSHTRLAIACVLAGMISTQIPATSNLAFAQGGYVGEARNNSNLINLSDSQAKNTVGIVAAIGLMAAALRRGEPIWPIPADQATEDKPSESSGLTPVPGLAR